MPKVAITINGQPRTADVEDPQMPLLYLLRNEFGLRGTHFGCGLGQCGACTVQVGGHATRSCLTPCGSVRSPVTTVEGVAEAPRHRHLVQAFEDMQAAQCGYCTPGMVVAAAALLARNARPSREAIVQALDPHLCRCGTHLRYVAAVERAVALNAGARA
ncbi:MAG TPA: (2Fe-2S)-binding protein [Ramlibacter sp.]|nr:(2Fe-2S)-binding protein [Ramlibacter sp.]